MDFKVGNRIEALKDGFIERDNCNNLKTNILLYKKGTKGTILSVWKDDLLIKFDSGYYDCRWSIPKKEVKVINKKNKINLKEKWNKFVKKDIIINCKSELDFEDFINFACKNSNIDYDNYKRCFEYYNNKLCFIFEDGTLYYSPKKYYVGEKEYDNFKILTWNEFIKNNEVVKMNKTFEDLVLEIKDGEVWSSDAKLVEDTNGNIVVRYKDGCERDFMVFSKNEIFEKVRKEYDYIEAYIAYLKEGKEIESIYSGINYKRMDEKDYYIEDYEYEWRRCSGMDFEEMNGKWYIND